MRAARSASGRPCGHHSVVDSTFDGRVVAETTAAGGEAVVTEVEGSAFRTGDHVFTLDERDPLGTGFLLR